MDPRDKRGDDGDGGRYIYPLLAGAVAAGAAGEELEGAAGVVAGGFG
jgi:hypothetical protein